MREIERIDRICEKIRLLWHKTPDRRLGQMIEDYIIPSGKGRGPLTMWIYYTEDDKTESRLDNLLEPSIGMTGMDENGIYCPECNKLIVNLPKENRDFDEIGCPYDNCNGLWVNNELHLVQLSQKHASRSEGDSVAPECPKCGASLIDMDWDLLKVEGGALLCNGCNTAFTEPPKHLEQGK